MGIERKKLSMSEKERLNTAIHESGHAIVCYFNLHANNLYNATIVGRGGVRGVASSNTSLISPSDYARGALMARPRCF